jgi:hypothetical protein
MSLASRSVKAVVFLSVLMAPSLLLAASPKKYQVTGTVLEVSDTLIILQKGEEKWEVGRDAATKVTGELKVGAKVTIEYRMTATSVEVKGEKAAGETGEKTGEKAGPKGEKGGPKTEKTGEKDK